MTPPETIALMGAHTLGHPMETNSMFSHYRWTANDFSLDNRFFVNIISGRNFKVRDPTKLAILSNINTDSCNLPVSSFIGRELGGKNTMVYKVKSEQRTETHGPWSWTLFGHGCSRRFCDHFKRIKVPFYTTSCCHHLDECYKKENHYFCYEKNFDCNTTTEYYCPQNWIQEISMINSDMGLYYDFDTDSNGRPINCPGLNIKKWLNNEQKYSDPVHCPEGRFHTTVARYANSLDSWIRDFIPVYTKMTENGVSPGDLRLSHF